MKFLPNDSLSIASFSIFSSFFSQILPSLSSIFLNIPPCKFIITCENVRLIAEMNFETIYLDSWGIPKLTDLQELLTQLKCFQRLAEQEEKAIPKRISEAKSRLETQKAQEIELQEEYKQKSLLRDDLTVRLGVLKARNWFSSSMRVFEIILSLFLTNWFKISHLSTVDASLGLKSGVRGLWDLPSYPCQIQICKLSVLWDECTPYNYFEDFMSSIVTCIV